MISLWRRLPIIVRAIITGGAVATFGTVPWALLASANQKFLPTVPWAVLPTGLYLWVFWRYLGGAGWPQSTAGVRRMHRRATRLPEDVWAAALLAGAIGLVALVLLLGIVNRLVRLPAQATGDLSRLPLPTLLVLLLMSSIVAGVAEESAFRGYMQGPIERRHGPLIAILVTGSLFGVAHLTHPEVGLMLMPYYLAVAAIYGMLAYLTNSILPSMVLHAGGNVVGYVDLLLRGRSEWQASPSRQALIWETGPDASFWMASAGLLVVGGAAVCAYAALANVTRSCRESVA
jgi:membrane protease YdiL (CAAX protease family)